MRRVVVRLLAAVMCVAVVVLSVYAMRERIPQHWQTPVRALLAGVQIDPSVRIVMSDGTRLAATLYRPKRAGEKLATVYIALPYDRQRYPEALGAAVFFARHGYAVLLQDVRGKFGSGGEFLPWRHATADGVASVDWIIRQPWSNGKVGTFGCSALGEVQYALARARHPAHAAMIPIGAGGAIGSAGGSYEYFGSYEGGIPLLASALGWFAQHGATQPDAAPMRPFNHAAMLRELPSEGLVRRARPGPNAYDHYMRVALGHPAWSALDFVAEEDRLTTPALVINSWGDPTLGGTMTLAERARRQGTPQHVVIAPGAHCEHDQMPATFDFGAMRVENASQPYWNWYLRWFDHWLRRRGDGLASLPPYLFFVNGENRWMSADAWPPPQATWQRWYLDSGGSANSRSGDGVLQREVPARRKADEYQYDPARPVPSRGGALCCTGDPAIRAGVQDQAEVEARNDVLVYTSLPLSTPLRIVGPLRARLVVSSSARDTDFVARLVAVDPNGKATNIQEGALRARFRSGITTPQLMSPGQRYVLSIDMRSIAYRLPAGHRLRLHVTSSSFPRLERNLNTGGDNSLEHQGVVAINRVHHGSDALSFVSLPVVP